MSVIGVIEIELIALTYNFKIFNNLYFSFSQGTLHYYKNVSPAGPLSGGS